MKKHEGDWKRELQDILQMKGRVTARGKTKPVSNRTLHAREMVMFMCMKQIREMGYDIQSVRSLKGKHVDALVARWKEEGISGGTIQNRLSNLRALCKWIGKEGMVQRTEKYAEAGEDPKRLKREVVSREDKSWTARGVIPERMIQEVSLVDTRVGLQLKLIHAFGLRREEAIQFRPHVVDEGGVLRIREGTKGGRERMVPVESDNQRAVLEEAKRYVPRWDGHMGRPRKTLKQNIDHFSYVMAKMGITRKDLGVTAHGLRHQRLNDIFEEVAGIPSPVRQAGGGQRIVTGDPELWKQAQQKVSNVAGHARLSISSAYTGSVTSVGKPRLDWTAGQAQMRITSVEVKAPEIYLMAEQD